ncbi:MAG: bis(5'-nucleosyl)-tetraphosphatase (symmetrical) YqeK [Chloroflexota bacterium]|nr:bis(5'-nucleosyl)-tetraphosphatase (symmetrical) YqeK [Chloroflexota bacterium]
MNDIEERLRAALTKVPAGLAAHVLRVVDEAARLARIHGIDAEAAKIAALGHDLLRAHSEGRLLTIAGEQGATIDPVDRLEPVLLHGPLAVPILREQYGVIDADVLGAVAAHTTAAPRMSRLQKLLFVADKIEPDKADGRAPVQRVRELADRDLDAAMRAYLDYHVLVALDERWPLHPNTIAARNELVAAERAVRQDREPGV